VSRPLVRSRVAIAIAAAIAVMGLGARGMAGDAPETGSETGLDRLWRAVERAIELAVAERGRRPPVPVTVAWRERRIASVDLGAPLLTLAAVDIDRDGRAELAALTTREVVLMTPAGKAMRQLGRAPLPGEPAAIRPRDPVGTLVVDARGAQLELLARTSEQVDGAAFVWRAGALQLERRVAGFPICPGGTAELAPGRNYFDGATMRWEGTALARFEPPATFFSAVCRGELGDPAGRPLWVTAVVDTERVAHLRCQAAQGECPPGPTQSGEQPSVGVAVEVGDIDNDGRPELLTTGDGPPGDRDRVSVYSIQGERVGRVFAKDFHAGVVGLAAGDLDGDGDRDVVVAVRFVGSHHVSFWTLN
jgi:hypothetical protein